MRASPGRPFARCEKPTTTSSGFGPSRQDPLPAVPGRDDAPDPAQMAISATWTFVLDKKAQPPYVETGDWKRTFALD
jgi:hypothetical protein